MSNEKRPAGLRGVKGGLQNVKPVWKNKDRRKDEIRSATETITAGRITAPIVGAGQLMAWDVFISHATEDKGAVADHLAEALREAGMKVWYDKFQLRLGDRLRRSIEEGLSNSRFGIVILSPSFFKKHWPQLELDGLAQREENGGKVILPIWHAITAEEIRAYSPILADRIAAKWEDGLEVTVKAILDVVSRTV